MPRLDRLHSMNCALYCQDITWLTVYEAKTVQPQATSEQLRIIFIGLVAVSIVRQKHQSLQRITVSIAVGVSAIQRQAEACEGT